MIKGRAEENASFFIFTIIALAITRVTARSRCVQTSPTSFVAYGKSSKGKVYQTYRRSVLASYGSPRGLVHVHAFTHFSSVLNLHSITYLLKIALTVHGFEPFSSLGRLGLICNGPVASPSFQTMWPTETKNSGDKNGVRVGANQGLLVREDNYSWTFSQRPPWGQRKVAVVERFKQESVCGLSAKKVAVVERWPLCGDPTVFHSEDTFDFLYLSLLMIFKSRLFPIS